MTFKIVPWNVCIWSSFTSWHGLLLLRAILLFHCFQRWVRIKKKRGGHEAKAKSQTLNIFCDLRKFRFSFFFLSLVRATTNWHPQVPARTGSGTSDPMWERLHPHPKWKQKAWETSEGKHPPLHGIPRVIWQTLRVWTNIHVFGFLNQSSKSLVFYSSLIFTIAGDWALTRVDSYSLNFTTATFPNSIWKTL